MKKGNVRAPIPTKVVLQYRLIALTILGALAIGLIYAPLHEGGVSLSPKQRTIAIPECRMGDIEVVRAEGIAYAANDRGEHNSFVPCDQHPTPQYAFVRSDAVAIQNCRAELAAISFTCPAFDLCEGKEIPCVLAEQESECAIVDRSVVRVFEGMQRMDDRNARFCWWDLRSVAEARKTGSCSGCGAQ